MKRFFPASLRILPALLACWVVVAFAPRSVAADNAEPAAHAAQLPADGATAASGTNAAPAVDHAEAVAHEEPGMVKQFFYSYLVAFMFCLSLVLGSLFLVIVWHLFDAGWSVPIRRFVEQIAALAPWMFVLWLPIGLGAQQIFPWMTMDPPDHALEAKRALFNTPGFYLISLFCFAVWSWLSLRLRFWSLQQDTAKPGDTAEGKLMFPETILCWIPRFLFRHPVASPSYGFNPIKNLAIALGRGKELVGSPAAKDLQVFSTWMMRIHSGYGIFLFAITLTLGCFFWMKSIQHQFFSTMYGVYYFAGSVWTILATVYVMTIWLSEKGTRPLKPVVLKRHILDIGVLFFAFTVFYAYIHFSQYFLIWNAAMPEETFWYVLREQGSWYQVGMIIVFGHFFVPFLAMLNQDIKLKLALMLPMCAWAWLMHYIDMVYNIMPEIHPDGVSLSIFDPLCWAGLVFIVGSLWWRNYRKSPPYPVRDPRLKEAVTHHVVPAAPGEAPAH